MASEPVTALQALLIGRACRVSKRESDWAFLFGELILSVSAPWRIVTAAGVVLGHEDDGQWFGLSSPVDGESGANEVLADAHVTRVEVDEPTADLRIAFGNGARLDLFNDSAGYEGWVAIEGWGDTARHFVGRGGGGLVLVEKG